MDVIYKLGSVLLTDVIVVSLLCTMSYIISHSLTLAPYSKSYSKFTNDIFFMIIPAVLYVAYRVYFQISFYILQLITKYLPSKLQPLETVLYFLFVISGLGFSLFFPIVTNTINDLYELYIGTLLQEVYGISKPEIQKSYDFGYKVITLVTGWFLLLFSIELVLRVLLYSFIYLYRLTVQPPKLSISSVKQQNPESEDGQSADIPDTEVKMDLK